MVKTQARTCTSTPHTPHTFQTRGTPLAQPYADILYRSGLVFRASFFEPRFSNHVLIQPVHRLWNHGTHPQAQEHRFTISMDNQSAQMHWNNWIWVILHRKVPNKPESSHHKQVLHIQKKLHLSFFLSEYFYEIAMGFVDGMLKSNDMHDKFVIFVQD